MHIEINNDNGAADSDIDVSGNGSNGGGALIDDVYAGVFDGRIIGSGVSGVVREVSM